LLSVQALHSGSFAPAFPRSHAISSPTDIKAELLNLAATKTYSQITDPVPLSGGVGCKTSGQTRAHDLFKS